MFHGLILSGSNCALWFQIWSEKVEGYGLAPFRPYSSNVSTASLPRLNETNGTVLVP